MVEAKLIEAMARAICRARGSDPDHRLAINNTNTCDDDPSWMNHREAARAAISAAEKAGFAIVPREPTEAMHEAANREWDGRMSARSAGVWQAMLAASEHERRRD